MEIFRGFHMVIAIYFYILLLIFHAKKKRLKLLTTRIFYVMIALTNINLALDVLTYYASTHPDIIPYSVGVMIFKLYFISCMIVFSTHFVYVKKMCVRAAKLSMEENIWVVIPNMIMIVVTLVSDLTWYPKDGFVRIDSVSITAILGITMVYSIAVLRYCLKYWKGFSPKIKKAELLTVVAWCVGFLAQLLTPVFIDMIGVTLISLMYIYFFYFENTSEIVDEKTGFFNKRGFLLMSEEYFTRKENFQIVNIGLDGMAYVRNQFGNECAEEMLWNMEQAVERLLDIPVFLFKENDLLLLVMDKETSEKNAFENLPMEYLSRTWNINGVNVKIDAKLKILNSSLVKGQKDVIKILNYITSPRFQNAETGEVMWIDQEILEKQERQEKIMTLLHHAIVNDGFDVYFQPIYDTGRQTFRSAEALVRLRDTETIGFVSPDEFITIAEEQGIISKIGDIVFYKVCQTIVEQKLVDKGIEYVEVNLSGKEVIDSSLADRFIEIMRECHVEPSHINLEITETASVTSRHMLQSNMNKLHKVGCSFSMDDFGTGYSNLAQIASMGYDIIKLDKSLIWPCFEPKGENSMIVLKNMIQMIHELGMEIVVEGVENEQQADKMREFGVTLHQGYFYAKPMPEEAFIAFMQGHNQQKKQREK